jgi:hypothetical protein
VIPHVVVRESRSISEGLARVEPPTEGLVPGMSVDVEIVVAEAERALQIPAEAVFTGTRSPACFASRSARRSPVKQSRDRERGESWRARAEDRVGPLHLKDGDR